MNNIETIRDLVHGKGQISPIDSKNFLYDLKANNILTEEELNEILYEFDIWARPDQAIDMPSDKNTLLLLCGRGFGKTWWTSNKAIDLALKNPRSIVAVWGADFGSVKHVNFLGESGIINQINPNINYSFNQQDLIIKFDNGSQINGFSCEAIERSRGRQSSYSIVDEWCAWRYPEAGMEAARLINRLGRKPQMFIATTPKPYQILKELAKKPYVYIKKGTTYDNYFLTKEYIKDLEQSLSDRMFRQECLAEILDDNPYALFKMSDIEKYRVKEHPPLQRIIVAVDPAVTSNPESDETGIIVAGLCSDNHVYVLEDASMDEATPEEWGAEVVRLYRKYNADRIVAEKNQGGDMVRSVIRAADRSLPPCDLVHASRGKEIRAEPVSAFYEHGEVHHVGSFALLERQMTEWNPTEKKKSPDRLDALVWACVSLLDKHQMKATVSYGGESIDKVSKKSYCSYG